MIMNNTLYTSGNTFHVKTDDGVDEYPSERIVSYINTIKKINQKNEWKTSGAGAKFMNAYSPEYDEESTRREVSINGASAYGDEIIYTATMGEVSGIFRKTLQRDIAEGLVMSSRDKQLYKVSVRDGKCAASIGRNLERHIAIFDIDTGAYRELTEGEVQEDYPSFSQNGKRLFYASAGLALSNQGYPVGVGPFGIISYRIESNVMDELLSSDKHDYIAPKEDKDGNLLLIKRPYRGTSNNSNLLLDIALFPVRILKAIGGLLNFFSIAFGGESLRSGGSARDVKTKQRNEKDIFFDGNVVNAQQELIANQRRGEKFPGIIPSSWELIRMDENGDQNCLKKGVMDYVICENGDIIYSNGNAIIRLSADGSEKLVEKCHMANNIVEVH